MTRDDAIQDALPSPVSDASSPVIEVAMGNETDNVFTLEETLVVEEPVTDNMPDFPFHEEHETYRDTIEKLAPLLGNYS